ncbi:capsular polysaccharide synthesis protein [uncultured Desulfovibrio sp.]|uniref:capsular polysaccharide synthesis protein n=1 Tax=uncultured Desulfovibrio sp. TaxID=167968 RepID=UPI0026318A2B|nr:capsular polysaccharide synthesis protein [uncultured Desulfovibrio sp.]
MAVISNAVKRLKIGLRALQMSSRACRFVEAAIAEDRIMQSLNRQIQYIPTPTKRVERADVDYVWQFWGQGIENAPPIVKVCVKSVSHNLAHKRHVVLSRDTVCNYVDLPAYVWDKYEKKIIPEAHFSDIVRLMLLRKYGGTWIDATVLLTKRPPDAFFTAPFFWFSCPPESLLGGSRILGSVWYLHAAKGQELVRASLDALLEYWKNYDYLAHYYILHLIFSNLIENYKVLWKEWESIPFYSSVPPHVLQLELSKPFNQSRFEDILEMSAVHKLTYYGINGDRESGMMTFYDYLTTRFGEGEDVI